MLIRLACLVLSFGPVVYAEGSSSHAGLQKRRYRPCSSPPGISHGWMRCSSTTYNPLTMCWVYCDPGYNALHFPIECREGRFGDTTSSWSGAFGCTAANCTSKPITSNGKFDCPSSIPIGASCNLTCDHGFKPGYSEKTYCGRGGRWSSVYCNEIKCPKPNTVNNGVIHCGTSPPYKLDDVCTVKCHPGYRLSSASETRCLPNDTWSTAACVEHRCPPPPSVSHGLYNCTDAPQVIGAVCGLLCDNGYKLASGVKAVKCLDNETWTGPQSCIEKKCLVPQHVTNGHLSCSTTSVRTGTSCSLSCESGFGPSFGISERTCQSDETWSESITCVDTSPPVFINCPPSQSHILKPNQTSINITWPEVKAIDSPNGNFLNVTLTSNLRPGRAYPAGNYTVHYEAMDESGNKAHPCSFSVSIRVCPSGSYLDVSRNECVLCPTGTYQEHEGRLTCVPCPTGFTTASEGSDSSNNCTGCPRGSYLDVTKMKCVLCPTGTYQEHEGRLVCTQCLHGFTTASKGSSSSSSCSGPCGPGSFSNDGLEPCSLCPTGTYQTRPGSHQCDACPVGRVTKMPGGKGPGECICPRGYFLMDVLLVTKCAACPKGTYQDQEDSDKCVYCPWGLSTPTEGSVSKTDCRAPCPASTSSSDGLQPCTPCPRGSYQSSSGKTKCDLCPNGHTTNTTGSLRATDCTVTGF